MRRAFCMRLFPFTLALLPARFGYGALLRAAFVAAHLLLVRCLGAGESREASVRAGASDPVAQGIE